MKKLSLIFVAFLLIPALMLTSCDSGTDPVVNNTSAFDLMKDYMVSNNLDIDEILTNTDGEKFVVGAPDAADLDAFLAQYYIMDIRSSDHFTTQGHIQGAKNVAFSDILIDAANAGTKPILVVCYTGQTACYATALLRMYGYPHTRALKWGMSGWNATTAGSWNSNIGNIANGHANWQYTAPPSNLVFSDPDISSFATDGSQILKQRVEQVVDAGFKTVSGSDVLNSPSSYFINNYFSEAHYTGFGHIDGAYRILPLQLADNSYLGLDPGSNAKVVTYCYTGQTSAVLTAVLRVLGYDAYSLTFGMNGLYNENPFWSDPAIKNQWGADSNPKDLPLVN